VSARAIVAAFKIAAGTRTTPGRYRKIVNRY
jgi:hypothetical protein